VTSVGGYTLLATIARRVAIDLYRREAIRAARPLESVAADDPALVDQAATDAVLEVSEVRRAVSELRRATGGAVSTRARERGGSIGSVRVRRRAGSRY
jgi:DNA-directed RNA polymerase specialized sigma24 family protein